MNILDSLYKELEELAKIRYLSLDDKKRLIYIRLCQAFSYDTRFHCTQLLPSSNRERLRTMILERRINLENVDDFRVCCTSFSYAYQDALKKLLNVDSTVIGSGHNWVELESDDQIIKADGTLGDLTRAKLEMRTRGYGPHKKSADYQELLECRDQRIKYIDIFYENIANLLLNGIKAPDYQHYYELDSEFDIMDSDERERHIFETMCESILQSFFLGMLYIEEPNYQLVCNIKNLRRMRSPIVDAIFSQYDIIQQDEDLVNLCTIMRIEQSFNELSGKVVQNYEDAKYLLEYMFQNVMLLNESDSFSQIDLFQNIDDDNWNFATIYIFADNNRPIYYVLRNEDNHWCFRGISLEEAQDMARDFKGLNKDILYRHR